MTALQALVGFALWTLALITLVFLYRGLRFLRGTPINHWPRGNKPQDDASVVKRLEDAHANCMENLPVFAVLVLAASLMDKTNTIQTIAPFVLLGTDDQMPEPGAPMSTVVLPHCEKLERPPVFVVDATAMILAFG